MILGRLVHTYNIKDTYEDTYERLSRILEAIESSICSTANMLESFTPYQLISGHDMVLQIENKDYKYIPTTKILFLIF